MYPLLWTILALCAAFVVAVLEVLLPTGGVFGVLAVLILITSIVFAFQVNIIFGSLYTLFICLLVPTFIFYALRFWPKTKIGQRILLEPEKDPALVPNRDLQSLKQLVGKHGIAKCKMLLGGLVEIEGNQYSAVSDVEPIDSGEVVRVIRIEGTCVIVQKSTLTESTTSPSAPPPIEDPFAT